MQIKRILSTLFVIFPLFCGRGVYALDGFSTVRCGSDIRQALIGKTMRNERVVLTENRNKDIGLKDLGGTEISDRLFLISWRICGDEYALLEEKDVVRDALKFPPHSKEFPQFIGSCQSNEGPVSGTVIAILKNEKGDLLPVKLAWSIDEKRAKFTTLKTEGLRCPRSDIITADQGER
jgi:hypothetical protein